MFKITLTDRLAFGDGLIKHRLGEGGLVTFIMPEPAIAEHVDDHIALELMTEVHAQANHLGDSFRILAIDMKNRDLKHLRDIRRVRARARLIRAGGKTNLVIDHHVQRSSYGVSAKPAQIQSLLHDAFASKRSVLVNQQR